MPVRRAETPGPRPWERTSPARLTVGWKDGAATESFTLVTHLVVLTTGAQRRGAPKVTP